MKEGKGTKSGRSGGSASGPLFSRHCGGMRHRRMTELLELMVGNEERGDITAHSDFPHPSKYRIFYAAERIGYIRSTLVPKTREGAYKRKGFVITEEGRRWLADQLEYMKRSKMPRPVRRGNPEWRKFRPRRPGEGMVPIRDLDARLRRKRREAYERARARMLERKAAMEAGKGGSK